MNSKSRWNAVSSEAFCGALLSVVAIFHIFVYSDINLLPTGAFLVYEDRNTDQLLVDQKEKHHRLSPILEAQYYVGLDRHPRSEFVAICVVGDNC